MYITHLCIWNNQIRKTPRLQLVVPVSEDVAFVVVVVLIVQSLNHIWFFATPVPDYSTPGFPCCSVAQSCPTLCDPMDCSTPGFPVLHHLPEFAQTHLHWVGDAIQPSHPLSSPSPPALNLSQHQDLFQWVGSLHPSTKVLELQLQHEYSGLISFRIHLFDLLAVQGTLKSQEDMIIHSTVLSCPAKVI